MDREMTDRFYRRQHGAALFIALIVLAMMMMLGIYMVRATSTSTTAVKNMAFRQVADNQVNLAVEDALKYLKNNEATLIQNNPASGYYASIQPAGSTSSIPGVLQSSVSGTVARLSGGQDNIVTYVIERMCTTDGAATAESCSTDGFDSLELSSNTDGKTEQIKMDVIGWVLYRVTIRVDGPSNTKAFSQAIVSFK